ncbi:Terminase small subunit [Rhizobium ruizarguesonis]
MPPLSNQRHEGFCRAICRGESAAKAYASVYGVTGHAAEASASRLLRNAAVLDRIDELQNGAAKRTEKTVESLVADLDEAAAFARQCGNPTALVSAIMAQAKLLGLAIDRTESVVLQRPAPWPTNVIELSEEQWIAQFGQGPGPMRALSGSKRSKANQRKPPPQITWDADTGEILKARIITIGGSDDDSD